MNVSSISGEITLDASGYKKGIDEAKKATQAFASEADRANASVLAFLAAEARAQAQTERLGDALKQETAFLKEMAAAEARLTAIRQGESRAAQDVAAKYHELSAAQRTELVAANNAIAAHEAQQKALQKAGEEADRFGQRLRTMGRAMNQAGREMTQLFTLPILAAGAGILKAGVDVDKGMDAIRLSSGATGERLKGLESDFKAVAATVPNSMEDVGRAIGLVATRTGLTGPPLQALTNQLLTVSRLTKTDLNQALNQSTRVFGDWGIKVAQQGPALDMLFRASEQTGIGFGKLEETLVRAGAPLRQMGFSFGEAAVLIGKFEKEGVRTDLVLGSLRIALTRLAKAGVTDAHQALLQIINSIKGAGTAAQANAIAMKVFGARAGPDMAAAIREGRFELGKLFDQVTKGQDTIAKAAKNTDDFGERFGQLRNKVELAVQPLGGKLMDALDNLGKHLIDLVPRLSAMVEKFNKMSPAAQNASLAFLAVAAVSGPVLSFFGKLIGAWGSLTVVMQSAAAQAAIAQIAVAGPWVAAAIVTIGGLVAAWETDFLHIRTGMEKFGALLADTFGPGLASAVKQAKIHMAGLADFVGDLQHRIGADRPGPSLMGSYNAARTGAVRDRVAALGPNALDARLFGGADMADAAARARRVVSTHAPPALPRVGTVGPGGPASGPTGPMNPALAALLAGKQNEADRIAKIFASARRSAIGAGRDKGDFATAEQQAALKLYTKDFDDLSAAQQKVADQLARIIVGGEKAAAAQAAHRKELRAHTAATKEAIHHAAILNAQTIDMQRQINQGGTRTHAAQAAAAHPLADPNAQAAERAAQADFDRMKARLAAINKIRTEIEGIRKQIHARRPEPFIGPETLESATARLKAITAADREAAKAKNEHAAAVKKFSDLLDTLNAQYRELTHVEETPSALLGRLPRGVLAPDVQDNINKARQQSIINAAVKATNEQNTRAEEALANAKANVQARTDDLNGSTAREANLAEELFRKINILNPAQVAAANAILDQAHANAVLEQSQKDAAKATREKEKIDNLLANTMADLNAEYDTLIGRQPEQTRAINRLIRNHKDLTAEQQQQLKVIRQMFRQRELMKGVREFADGMEGIFQSAFEGLSKGFKGFFAGIYQGFKQLLIRMAAEYLASQLKQVVLKGLTALIGAATGGGGGGGGAAPSGGGWGGGFARGGSVQGGRPIWTGERGPELFVPSSSGRIVPHSELAGVGGHTFNVTVNVQGEHLPAARQNASAMAQQIGRELSRQQRRNGNG